MKSCYPKRATSLPLSLSWTAPAGIPKSLQSDLKVEAFIRTSWSAKRIDPSTPCSQTREDSSPNPSLSSHATTSATLHFEAPYKEKEKRTKKKVSCERKGKKQEKSWQILRPKDWGGWEERDLRMGRLVKRENWRQEGGTAERKKKKKISNH